MIFQGVVEKLLVEMGLCFDKHVVWGVLYHIWKFCSISISASCFFKQVISQKVQIFYERHTVHPSSKIWTFWDITHFVQWSHEFDSFWGPTPTSLLRWKRTRGTHGVVESVFARKERQPRDAKNLFPPRAHRELTDRSHSRPGLRGQKCDGLITTQNDVRVDEKNVGESTNKCHFALVNERWNFQNSRCCCVSVNGSQKRQNWQTSATVLFLNVSEDDLQFFFPTWRFSINYSVNRCMNTWMFTSFQGIQCPRRNEI